MKKRSVTMALLALALCSAVPAASASASSICNRTFQVRAYLEHQLGKPCDQITDGDLGILESMDLEGTLGNPPISTLKPGDFAGLSRVKWLNLSFGAFTTLPLGVFDGLNSLTSLSLATGAIETLPDGIFNDLPSLNQLDLSVNHLVQITSKTFTGLKALTSLDLSFNHLPEIPAHAFSESPQLRVLYLNANGGYTIWVNVAGDAFSGLGELRELWLGSMNIKSLPDGAFAELSQLETLNLNGGSLGKSLSAETLRGLGNLITILLDGDELTDLDPQIFKYASKLQVIDLSINKLTALDPSTFNGLPDLKRVDLSDNPLTDDAKAELRSELGYRLNLVSH